MEKFSRKSQLSVCWTVLLHLFVQFSICYGQTNIFEPLSFTTDRRDGRKVWIQSAIDYYSPGVNRQISKIWYRPKNSQAGQFGQNSQFEIFAENIQNNQFLFIFTKPHGICMDYEFRVEFQRSGAPVFQTLPAPKPELSMQSRIRLERVFAQQQIGSIISGPSASNRQILAQVTWGRTLDFWTPDTGAVLTGLRPWIKLIRCQTVFPNGQSPPPPQIKNEGRIVEFQLEHAIHNCTFQFGLRFILQVSANNLATNVNQPGLGNNFNNQQLVFSNLASCQREFDTGLEDSLFININCQNVAGLTNCRGLVPDTNLGSVSGQDNCVISCSPRSVVGQGLESGNREYLSVNWNFENLGFNQVARQRVRYSESLLSSRNTIIREENVQEKSLAASQKSLQIYPPPGRSTNYTFQVCALRSSNCGSQIRWGLVPKYPIEFRTKSDRRKDEPPGGVASPRPIIRASFRSAGSKLAGNIGLLIHMCIFFFSLWCCFFNRL